MAADSKNPNTVPLPEDCNVVDCSSGQQQFWRFTKGKQHLKLVHVSETEADAPINANFLKRDASQMWNAHCQNDAWMSPEHVFFRVLHLPLSDPGEVRGMVELQLESLSPLPLRDAVWTYEVAPVFHNDRPEQTVVVMIASREVVEECVGALEKIGYRPDRLETPVLHQVMATPQGGDRPDGAWIYPRRMGERILCTVAWWDEGVLHNITQITLTSAEHLNELTAQLTATTWAGEMEGWLTGTTDWHLIADNRLGEDWLPILNDWAQQGMKVHEPPEMDDLAAVSAARAARPLEQGNLLPPERAAQYHRDDGDNLIANVFIGGLVLYLLLLVGYFIWKPTVMDGLDAAKKENKKLKAVQSSTRKLMVDRMILTRQREMRWTALNVMKSMAENMPPELTVRSLSFNEMSNARGNKIALTGSVKSGDSTKAREFSEALLKAEVADQSDPNADGAVKKLFTTVNLSRLDNRGDYSDWTITATVEREEIK